MLNAYGTAKDCLIEFAPGDAPGVPEGTVWLDMVEPTADEEKAVEAALGIDIPTREELAEIEASSRLYQEDGAAFMTANLIRRGDNDRPESSPVTFIIKDNVLITIRYHHPQAFPVYVKRAMKPQSTAMTGWGIYISLLEAVVDRAADHLERVALIVEDTSRKTFGTGRVMSNDPKAKRQPRKRGVSLTELIENIGEEGDFTSKMREKSRVDWPCRRLHHGDHRPDETDPRGKGEPRKGAHSPARHPVAHRPFVVLVWQDQLPA